METREWYLVYHKRPARRWWGRFLHPDFRHVELTRRVSFGDGLYDCVWLNLLPNYGSLDAEVCTDPRPPWEKCPTSIVQKVTALLPPDHMRDWFSLGPQTCVEVAKMALGFRAFWIRTPYQLYKYVAARGGVLNG